MKLRFWPAVVASIVLIATPIIAAAAGLVPCGNPTPGTTPGSFSYVWSSTSCGLCDFGVLIQNVINFLLGVGILIAVIMFAYAGILYFTSAANPSQIKKAQGIFKSVLIGFGIALSSWLIVQTFLTTLLDHSFFTSGDWSRLQCANDFDRLRNSPISDLFKAVPSAPVSTTGPGAGYGQVNPGQGCAGPLSATSIQAAAAQAGYTLNTSQANTLSCLAGPESTCGNDLYGGVNGASVTNPILQDSIWSGATGPLQIVIDSGTTDPCHNLNNNVCLAAAQKAGYTGQILSCGNKAFYSAHSQACIAAAIDPGCSAAAAACLVVVNNATFTSQWGSQVSASDNLPHTKQQQCIVGNNQQ